MVRLKAKNILLVSEGSTDKVLFEKINGIFFNNNLSFFIVRSSIHALYNTLKRDEFTDTVKVLKEMTSDNNDRAVLNNNFFSIYLIFDFDPQDSAYDRKHLTAMLDFFSNETEMGKLYLNYPMLESFYDHSNFNLDEYINRVVPKEDLGQYKKLVNKRGCKIKLCDYSKRTFNKTIKLNLLKASLLILDKKDLPAFAVYQEQVNQKNIFMIQDHHLRNKKTVSILNTSVFLVVDYLGKSYYESLI